MIAIACFNRCVGHFEPLFCYYSHLPKKNGHNCRLKRPCHCIVLHYSFAAVKTLRSTRVQYLTLIGPVSIRVCTKHFSKMIINVRHAARSLQHVVLKMFFIYGNWCSVTLILVTDVGNSFCWWQFWVIVTEIL